MDPDANLAEQLRLSARLIFQVETDKPLGESDVSRLAELVLALHEWIANGGFPPRAWRKET